MTRSGHPKRLFFLGVIISTCSMLTVILSPEVRLVNRRRLDSIQVVADVHVEWHTTYNDTSTSRILHWDEDQNFTNTHKALVFNPSPHTGSQFFHRLILSNILSQRLPVKIFDQDREFYKAISPDQKKTKLKRFVRSISADDAVYIYTDVSVGSDKFITKEGSLFKPLSVVLMRRPVEVVLSSFHDHRYGEDLFQSFENSSLLCFESRTFRLINSLLRLRNNEEKDFITHAFSHSSFAKFLCSERCTGKKRSSWNPQTLVYFAKETLQVRSDQLIVVPITDFAPNIPKILQQLVPEVCYKLGDFDAMPANSNIISPPWTRQQLYAQIPETLKERLLSHKYVKHENSFYNWLLKKYYVEKVRVHGT